MFKVLDWKCYKLNTNISHREKHLVSKSKNVTVVVVTILAFQKFEWILKKKANKNGFGLQTLMFDIDEHNHKIESDPENETHKILWHFEIQTDERIPVRRPDQVMINKKQTEPAE